MDVVADLGNPPLQAMDDPILHNQRQQPGDQIEQCRVLMRRLVCSWQASLPPSTPPLCHDNLDRERLQRRDAGFKSAAVGKLKARPAGGTRDVRHGHRAT
jgi:hypothetical protein